MRHATKKVLNALQHLSDPDGLYSDGYGRLADHAGCVPRTVTTAMAELVELGHVEIVETRRGNLTSVIRVLERPDAPQTRSAGVTLIDDLASRLERLETELGEMRELVAHIEPIRGQMTILIEERQRRIEVAAKQVSADGEQPDAMRPTPKGQIGQ